MKKDLRHASIFIYFLSAIIIICSFYISYSSQNWQWLSRSGSLIVILGIYLTSSQIIENSRRLSQRYRGAQQYGNFQRDWAGNKQEKILHHARNHEEETWIMGKCGFNLLILGTFIWGFGDLFSIFF